MPEVKFIPKPQAQSVSTFDAGTLNSDGYGDVSGFSVTGLDYEELVRSQPHVPDSCRKRVLIVGAGITGIQQAAILLDETPIKREDMVIVDAQEGYGGVWAKNKYPGCACDVPAIIYTTSFWINKLWTHFYARRDQIEDYYARFAHAYGLHRCTDFNSLVRACIWDDKQMAWHVFIEKKGTGRVTHWVADVLCQCVGSLDTPKFGNTPGRENFKGISWHTAHWREDCSLVGKKVAMIGCGPSAAQIIPEIIDKVGELTVYMRTPPVCVPRNDYAYSSLFKWAVNWVPGFIQLVRFRMNVRMGGTFKSATNNSRENNAMTATAVAFMESQVSDPVLREKVRPDSKYYCKRPLRLDNFYTALAKPNCLVLRDRLVRYTEAGVVSADRKSGEETERPVDVIIYGTGFNTAQHLEHESILGIGGLDLQKRWADHPEALYGLATNQFPNMFMCFGPNSASLWNSQQDNWELQARFAAKAVKEIIKRGDRGEKLAIHPALAREREYNDEVQVKQSQFVWSEQSCVTYYKNDDGWNTYTMPWTFRQFRNFLSKIRWGEWTVISKKA
ncbi:hypothetical protein EDB80DRAFT_836645 [Ilyonectria destructans]|nr:hypothetical protein EDB80DRAFT_836645 [Ilyonectria destructans]